MFFVHLLYSKLFNELESQSFLQIWSFFSGWKIPIDDFFVLNIPQIRGFAVITIFFCFKTHFQYRGGTYYVPKPTVGALLCSFEMVLYIFVEYMKIVWSFIHRLPYSRCNLHSSGVYKTIIWCINMVFEGRFILVCPNYSTIIIILTFYLNLHFNNFLKCVFLLVFLQFCPFFVFLGQY